MCRSGDADEFSQFPLEHFSVAVLRVLNEEYHPERNDTGDRIDHELPAIAEFADWTDHGPADDDDDSETESEGMAG